MRKVKVAAALFCVMTAGLIGGTAAKGREMSAASTVQLPLIQEITAESAASAVWAAPTLTAASSDSSAEQTETTLIAETTETTETATAAETEITETTESSALTDVLTEPVIPAQPLGYSAEPSAVTTVLTAATTVTTTVFTTASTASTTASTVTTTAAPVVTTTAAAKTGKAITVTQNEYYMLCNVLAHEYGADWVPVEEKALIIETIMNRVNSPLFPNTIYEVLMQKGQFPGLQKLIELGTFSSQVTDSVKAAVDLYLSDPSQFNHGYLFFSGDGKRAYFRTTYK